LKSFNEKGKKDVEKIPTKVQTWNNS
jgi:hypothetical protein